jgi:hypothetical protein
MSTSLLLRLSISFLLPPTKKNSLSQPFDVYDSDNFLDTFQKFLFCGYACVLAFEFLVMHLVISDMLKEYVCLHRDDRNIVEVYVSGETILKVLPTQ